MGLAGCYNIKGVFSLVPMLRRGFPGGSVVKKKKNLSSNSGHAGDTGLIPGLGRSLGVGNGNLLQDSCLENSINRGAYQTTVHGITESDMTE